MQIFVRIYKRHDVRMVVQDDDTIARTIQRMCVNIRKKIILMFGGRVLDYKKTISECEIYEGAVLEVRARYLKNTILNYTKHKNHTDIDEYEIDEHILLHDIDDLATNWSEEYDRTKYKQERKSES